MQFSEKSEERLSSVAEPLQSIIRETADFCTDEGLDFGVAEGLRTLERQKKLVAEGKSQTLESKHLEGKAIDIYRWVDGRGDTYKLPTLREQIEDIASIIDIVSLVALE